jgi:hypothetical protein
MRLTIIAGLVIGVSLGIRTMLGARARTTVVQAVDVRPTQVSGANAHRDRALPRIMKTKPLISTLR